MMILERTLLIVAAFFLIGSPNAVAGKKHAIVVGISRYQHVEQPVSFAERDARYFGKILSRFCDFSERNIHLLTGQKGTRENIRKTIVDLDVQQDDMVVFYFSGHGTRVRRTDSPNPGVGNYEEVICPYDFDDNRRSTFFTGEDLLSDLESLNARNTLIVLDCCHSVGEPASVNRGGFAEDLGQNISERGVEGRILLSAASRNEKAFPQNSYQLGAFTCYLGKAISGGGINADGDADGRISAGEAFLFAKSSVTEYTGKRQNPQMSGDSGIFDSLFLSNRSFSDSLAKPAYMRITRAAHWQLQLDLGLNHGLLKQDVGARLFVLRQSEAEDGESGYAGEAILAQVYNDSSIAQCTSNSPDAGNGIHTGDIVVFSSVSGSARIDSKPGGADVIIRSVPETVKPSYGGAGRTVGVTPFEFDKIPPGRWTFAVRKSGFRTSRDIVLDVGESDRKAVSVVLEQQPGSLRISSNPSGFDVRLRGETRDIGRTPFELTKVIPGQYVVSLYDTERTEYDSLSDAIDVGMGRHFEKVYEMPRVSVFSRIHNLVNYLLLNTPLGHDANKRLAIRPFRYQSELIQKYQIGEDIKTAVQRSLDDKDWLALVDDNPELEIAGEIDEMSDEYIVSLELYKGTAAMPVAKRSTAINKNLFHQSRNLLLQHVLCVIPGVGRLYANEDEKKGVFMLGSGILTAGAFVLSQSAKNNAHARADVAYAKYEKEIEPGNVSQFYREHQGAIDDAGRYRNVQTLSAAFYGLLVLHELWWSWHSARKYNDREDYLSPPPPQQGFDVGQSEVLFGMQFTL